MEPGSIFAGRYRVVRRMAAGGMGAVYEVSHLATERNFALKVMLPEFAQEAGLRERFQHEARIAARVESEHIVEVVDAGLDEPSGTLFLVMELLRGEELGARVKRLGRLSDVETVAYLRQAASALDKTHARSIIHRDLKPENLFVTWREDGSPRVKLLDFGIAKVLAESTTAKRRTESIGTPLYMAPEQFGGVIPSPATDIYALGLIAYTLLVGEAYWDEEATRSDNALVFALKVSTGPQENAVERAARAGVQLPEPFGQWFAHATHAQPSQRFASASECVEGLATALAGGRSEPQGLAEPLAAMIGAAKHTVGSQVVLTATAPVPISEALPAMAESSAHSLSVSSVPQRGVGSPSKSGRRWMSASGVVVVAAAAAVFVRYQQSNVDLEGGADGVRTTGTLGASNPESTAPALPPTVVVADSQTASGATTAAATEPTVSPSVTSGAPVPETATAGGSVPLSSSAPQSVGGDNSASVHPAKGSASPPIVATSRPGATPKPSATPGLLCYEHPDSGRLIIYTPGALTRGQKLFACYRTPNGQPRRQN